MRQRSLQLRRAIDAMDFLVSGHLHERFKTCGRPNCRCATDPEARHGPYFQWTHRDDGRYHHHVVTPAQAQLLIRAIANHREVQHLLAQWGRETAAEILNPDGTERE